MRIFLCGWILIGWMVVGCVRRPTPSGVAPSTGSPTPVPIPTGRSVSTPTVPTPTATALPTPTPTPDPYADLTVEALRRRAYGGGSIRIERTLAVTPAFTRTLIAYPSDGLTVYGFMNVPRGKGPFPAVIVLHGYVDPARYSTLAYTTRYADALARAGFLVLHPNYRNHPPSDEGPNPFRVGYAVDVLNLIALLPTLPQARADAVGLFGHSMGGGIALRVLVVNPRVRAAVLYGSMSADERKNFERILQWSGGTRGREELNTPEEALRRISPLYYLQDIATPIQIHHGGADSVVPPEWSRELYERLRDLGKTAEWFEYPGQPHTFPAGSAADRLLLERAIAFFRKYLGESVP
ncbi:alpha/beta hydrolase family protein [Thermoflexus hugenholtzii]|uniref:Dipeptidyl aminopeptidases/acylaminoacyl-peptidases n=1 Tax=Thermoflexus hugenholtzii JAD2 TaxID=877466 RepID=A0A212PXR4_9CHLR|nr:alpha/beta fold hydrolase [Thermoflexus hugenholtzii]SNB51857.1 Dipeptidyl aminopeptidases/acylaminoacyl-peptidases [Thermoflexus hugenholtzii JAD2]